MFLNPYYQSNSKIIRTIFAQRSALKCLMLDRLSDKDTKTQKTPIIFPNVVNVLKLGLYISSFS